MTGWDEASLRAELGTLPQELRERLRALDFDTEGWLDRGRRLASGSGQSRPSGQVEFVLAQDLLNVSALDEATLRQATRLGEEALRAGECALVVLAGGMATRMGGIVKALADALPGHTFLDLRLREQASLAERFGATPPLWLMTSHGTHEALTTTLGERLDGVNLAAFPQSVSLRWTPQAALFRGGDGLPSLYASGHGDLPDALRRSGLLDRFVAGGGRYVMACNIDNLGAGLDPLLIGLHLLGDAAISCEVVDKIPGDRGGIPVRVGDRAVILEEFLLPSGFDPTRVTVFNSNTLAFDARALLSLEHEWSYFEVHKQVDGQEVVQFERLVHESTFWLPTRYLRVPREGASTRFLPCKDLAELEARRPAIEALARQRGML
ncbi:MAG TPA: UTP--glucose-1-phosphate uridylyltransferase [Polyangiaceae bacterium]|nr:UTP--glucose-1-phosphate uridylyltransferase [Polyangiaceae bacterium]